MKIQAMKVRHVGDHGAYVRRTWLKTLLVNAACGGVLALLPDLLCYTQGRLAEARLTLGFIPQPLWGRGRSMVEDQCCRC
jgi:hypothetical protein